MTLPTLFGEERFVAAVCRALPRFHPLAFRHHGEVLLYGAEERGRFGQREVHLGPFGMYASPSSSGDLDAAVNAILRQACTLRTIHLRWSVRFDQQALASSLRRAGVAVAETSALVLPLSGNHDVTFAGFNATRRNEVRRAAREGVTVRTARGDEDIDGYHRLYVQLCEQKGRPVDFTRRLFRELATLPDTTILIAEHGGAIAAAGMYFSDVDSSFYFNSAADRVHSRVFPTAALLDHAIKLANERGLRNFNFGATGHSASLAEFKRSWGAQPLPYWKFYWTNKLWTAVQQTRALSRRVRAMLD